MSELTINNTLLGGNLTQILEANDIGPGSQAGYDLCKTLWTFHPLGGKLVEKPVRLALSKPELSPSMQSQKKCSLKHLRMNGES